MSFTIYARMKKLGKQKKADIVPVPFVLEKKPECVRDLLDGLVRLGVRDYNARKDAGLILPYLTKEEKPLPGRFRFMFTRGRMPRKNRRWKMLSSVLKTGFTGYLQTKRN